jgi:putative MATE family efflux protein
MEQSTNINALRYDPINKILKKLAIPASLAMFISALYNIVDTIFVGRLIGWEAIAALAIANPIQMILLALGQVFGIGAASIISRSLGSDDHLRANKALGNSLSSMIIISFFTAILGTIFITPLLKLFGASSQILPYAYDYMIIILPFSIFRILSVGLNNVVRAVGNAKLAMFTMIVGAIVNIILDPIFIYYLDMGIRGAAIATVIAQGISVIITITYLMTPNGSLSITKNNLIPNLSLIKEMISIGIPSFFRQAGASILAIILNNLLGLYGDIYISIYGVILKITSFTFMPALGIFQGMVPILGYNYGAKSYDRVKEVIKLARKWAIIIMLTSTLIIEIFPASIISIFSTDPELVKNGVLFVRLFFLAFWIIPLNVAGSNTFQAIGHSKLALVSALMRQFIVLIPVLTICFNLFGLIGIFISFPIADVIASLTTNYLLTRQLDKIN